MAVRTILRMGDPRLRKKSQSVALAEIRSSNIQKLIDDLEETMRQAKGLGLAAPQVGENLRIALVEIPENSPRYPGTKAFGFGVYINPKVRVLRKKQQAFWEGCLSVPGLRGEVKRANKISVEYYDRHGERQKLIAEGFTATVFQHEFDHLDGILFVDRVQDKSKLAYLEEYLEFHYEK